MKYLRIPKWGAKKHTKMIKKMIIASIFNKELYGNTKKIKKTTSEISQTEVIFQVENPIGATVLHMSSSIP
jgi:hypothetical protein